MTYVSVGETRFRTLIQKPATSSPPWVPVTLPTKPATSSPPWVPVTLPTKPATSSPKSRMKWYLLGGAAGIAAFMWYRSQEK
jgi:hypothetical protein